MTDAEKAYAEAERLIAKEKEERTGQLDLSGYEFVELEPLAVLPPTISDLHWILWLDVNQTQISDLTAIKNLSALKELRIDYAPVEDLTSLKGITTLERLYLRDTKITNIEPLQNLTRLTEVFFDNTSVKDIAALQYLPALRSISFSNTKVRDIKVLAHNTTITSLKLASTRVSDLRPCRGLLNLGDNEFFDGLFFNYTLATRIDPTLFALSNIENDQIRTRKTLDYLNSLDDAEYDAFLARRKRKLGIVEGEAVAPPPKPSPTAKARAKLLAPNIYAHREVILPLADQIQTALRKWQNETGTNQLPEALQLIEHLACGFALAVKQSDIQGLEARLAYLESEGQKLAMLLNQEQAKTAALSHELSEAKAAKFAPAFREEMGKRSAQMVTGGVYAFTGLGVTYLLGEAHPITKTLISLISPK